MYELIEPPKTRKVTKVLAREFVEMDAAPNDRALSERRLAVYERIIQQQGFRPCCWARAHCVETGTVYRVNGKHTSTLFSTLDPLPELYVVIEDYKCETLEDVARLYGSFDSRTQSRTAREINASFAGTVAELADVPRKIIDVCVSGISFHLWGSQYGQRPAAERAELMLDQVEFVLFTEDLVGAGHSSDAYRKLGRGPVAAAIFATYKKAPNKAKEFWEAVRDETGSVPSLPDRKLAKFLVVAAVDTGVGSQRYRKAEAREFYVRSLHAWNAWRRGENTDLKYYKDAKIPTVI